MAPVSLCVNLFYRREMYQYQVLCNIHVKYVYSGLAKTGVLNEFVRHETLSSSEIQAKLKLNETLGPLWSQVLVTVSLSLRYVLIASNRILNFSLLLDST